MVCVLESFWTWRSKSQFHFSTVHGGFQDCFSRFRGIPNCGHCADANARKASATKCGWEWIMDFHPDVSIMSAAWLKNKSKRCLLRSTLQNASLHCHFFFFLIYRFQNSVSYVFTPLELTNISSSPYWCFLLWLELSISLQVGRSWSVWLWSAELDSHCHHLYTHSSKSSFLWLLHTGFLWSSKFCPLLFFSVHCPSYLSHFHSSNYHTQQW